MYIFQFRKLDFFYQIYLQNLKILIYFFYLNFNILLSLIFFLTFEHFNKID